MRAGRVEYARPHTKMRAKQIKGENARTKPKMHILKKRAATFNARKI